VSARLKYMATSFKNSLIEMVTLNLDRIQLIAKPVVTGDKPPVPHGYRVVAEKRTPRQTTIKTYALRTELVNECTGTRLFIQHDPQQPFLAPIKITIVPEDGAGFHYSDLMPIVAVCRDYRLVTLEMAFDCHPDARIDHEYVRRHARFGKSRGRDDRGGPDQLRYGARHSGKLVRCYQKAKLGAYRVELELHSQLLRQHGIRRIENLDKAQFVFPGHIRFVTPSWKRLFRFLNRKFGAQRAEAILSAAKRHAPSLPCLCAYLRSKGICNVHRFFDDTRINREVNRALQEWARSFFEKEY
jgi:hypothetical protein